MSFKSKITVFIFIINILFMAGLFYGMPLLTTRPELHMALILFTAGLILSGVLTIIVYSFTKKMPGKPMKAEKKVPEAEKPAVDAKAVQMLSLLQKNGRLMDFLQEDISSYEDNQIGAAVRNIHKGCLDAINEHMDIEPVLKENEGAEITLEEGFDPSAVRLTGNVVGSPPFKGILRHGGWRVSKTHIPSLPEHHDLSVIEPAEVEVI